MTGGSRLTNYNLTHTKLYHNNVISCWVTMMVSVWTVTADLGLSLCRFGCSVLCTFSRFSFALTASNDWTALGCCRFKKNLIRSHD